MNLPKYYHRIRSALNLIHYMVYGLAFGWERWDRRDRRDRRGLQLALVSILYMKLDIATPVSFYSLQVIGLHAFNVGIVRTIYYDKECIIVF